jgi:ADP-dependent NAD(P)H-hydrate dehydratase / NAD(P)H-hydrate epimerase
MKILTARQIKEVDISTTARVDVPSLLLMENAAQAIVHSLESWRADLRGLKILIFCGKGNNGGDGMAAARLLHIRGCRPEVCLLADPNELHGDALQNYKIASLSRIPIHLMGEKASSDWPDAWHRSDVVIDGILGTGLRGSATGLAVEAIEWINQQFQGHVLAIDLPSGLDADSGELPGPSVCADTTVTFTAPKLCHVLTPGCVCCGKTWVAPIGTPSFLLETNDFHMELITRSHLSPVILPREIAAHKGSFGRILILAGSRGKCGAAAMAGMAALRSGAGLVKVAVPSGIQSVASSFSPEYMTEGLPETAGGFFSIEAIAPALDLARSHDIIAIGPGIGQAPEVARFLEGVLRESQCPVVLDADAINCIANYPVEIQPENKRILVMTPHPGEMARLTGLNISEIQRDRVRLARSVAMERKIYLVLKGARTINAGPDGRIHINPTGNPGMATAGSGDVLTGMIAAILGQQMLRASNDPMDVTEVLRALDTAVYWHGLAGDAASFFGRQQSLTATDLIRLLPETHCHLVSAPTAYPGGLEPLFPEPVFKK